MWQPPPLPRTLTAALRDLHDPSPRVRASAAHDLVPHADDARPQVAEALIEALADPHFEPRAAAARALGEVRFDEASAALIAAVDDEHPMVRQMAAEALGSLSDEASRERLRRALDDERPEVRFQAVMALGRRLDEDEADRVLARACRDGDKSIRYIALRLAEERWPGPTGAAPRTHQAAQAALRGDDPSARVAAALLLAARGDDAGAEVLLAVVEGTLRPDDVHDEAAAVEAAGALGLRQAQPALERRAWGLGRLLRERCSFHARVSLALLGHPRARGEILEGLRAWSLSARNEAVLAAGKARLDEARPLIEAMEGRPERADALLVREALESIGPRR